MPAQALPGEQWIPSNSDVGYSFLAGWCSHCARDRAMREWRPVEECADDECCPIVAASFRGEAVEWRELDGGQVVCTQFVPAGEVPPPPRCPFTTDMFNQPSEGNHAR